MAAPAPQTVVNRFANSVSGFVARDLLPHISEWLRTNKKVEVTVDELVGACQLPAAAPTTAYTGMPQAATLGGLQMPNFAALHAAPAARAGGGGGRAKPKGAPGVPANYDGPTCQYKFVRGKQKGELCGEPVVPGTAFCRQCGKKKSAGGEATPATPAAAPTGAFRGLTNVAATPATERQVDVIPLPTPGFFRETTRGFILKQLDNGNVVAVGVDVNGQTRPLTDQEKQVAIGMGFATGEAAAAPTPTVAPVPTLPNLMTLPTLNNTAPVPTTIAPTPAALPTIPQIPGLGVPTIPQIPGLPALARLA